MLVLRGASLGAGMPARARLRRGDGSEGRGLRSGNAVVLRCPSGRPLRRSSGASDLGGGMIWHARVRHCCAVRTIQSYRFTLMRLFVCLVSDTQVPTSWHALRIGLVDLAEAAPIGIFLGSSAPLQVELRMSPACRCGGASVARAPNRGPGGRVRHRCLSASPTVIRVMVRKR